MTCPHCSGRLREGAQFCVDCGFYIQPPPGRQREAAVVTASYATTGLRAAENEIEPGSLVLRFIAAVVDTVVLLGASAGLVLAFVMMHGEGVDTDAFFRAAAVLSLPVLLLQVAYWAGFETSRFRATPGKLLFGLAVTDADGEGLALPHAICRWFLKSLIGAVFPIGYLFALFTPKKQTLYDLIAGTAVIER